MTLVERILSRCHEDGDCLIWPGAVCKDGRPMIRPVPTRNLLVPVRRILLEAQGHDMTGKMAACTCQRPRCVGHIAPMTRAEVNARTNQTVNRSILVRAKRAQEARTRIGKLNEEARQLIDDRTDLNQRQLAEMLGVHKGAIGDYRRGETYKTYSSPFAGLIS